MRWGLKSKEALAITLLTLVVVAAEVPAMVMSQHSVAMAQPPPAAGPCTRPMTGFDSRRSRSRAARFSRP